MHFLMSIANVFNTNTKTKDIEYLKIKISYFEQVDSMFEVKKSILYILSFNEISESLYFINEENKYVNHKKLCINWKEYSDNYSHQACRFNIHQRY